VLQINDINISLKLGLQISTAVWKLRLKGCLGPSWRKFFDHCCTQ